MPKVPIDYANCKIYRLVCKDLSIPHVYVGHTTDMIRRKANHKSHCSNNKHRQYNFNVYRQIRANGGFNNWSMLLVEDFPCANKYQAKVRERYWCEELHADLNTQVPGRTREQYHEDNKEYMAEYYKEYANRKVVCACGSTYNRSGKTLHLRTKKHQKFISSQCIASDAEETTDCETDSTL